MELICLGDSLTSGYGVRRAQCWVSLVGQTLGCVAVNLGIPGDTTGGMLSRLSPQVMVRLKEEGYSQRPLVLLSGGTNDILYADTAAIAKGNLGAMVHQLLTAGVSPVVVSPLPLYPQGLAPQWQAVVQPHHCELLRDYCRWQCDFCRAFGVTYISLNDVLRDKAGQLRPSLYLDGLHPTTEGHRLIAQKILQALCDERSIRG